MSVVPPPVEIHATYVSCSPEVVLDFMVVWSLSEHPNFKPINGYMLHLMDLKNLIGKVECRAIVYEEPYERKKTVEIAVATPKGNCVISDPLDNFPSELFFAKLMMVTGHG